MKTPLQTRVLVVGATLLLVLLNQHLSKAQAPIANFSFSLATAGSVNFASTSSNVPQNVVYRWLFGDGTSSPTLSLPTTSHTYTANGVFYAFILLQRPDGILYDSIAKPVSISNIATGLKTNAGAGLVSVYPNPAKDVVNIKLEDLTQGSAGVTVYDIMGRALGTAQPLIGGVLQLNTSGYAAGPYMLQIKAGDLLLTRKIVVVRD